MIEKTQRVWFAAPGRRHIRRNTVVPHARAWEAWLLRCARPSLGLIRSLATKAGEEEGFPEIRHCCIFYRGFRTMSDTVAKQMKGFERKLPSRHLSLSQADTVRHKSGISLPSPGLTTSD